MESSDYIDGEFIVKKTLRNAAKVNSVSVNGFTENKFIEGNATTFYKNEISMDYVKKPLISHQVLNTSSSLNENKDVALYKDNTLYTQDENGWIKVKVETTNPYQLLPINPENILPQHYLNFFKVLEEEITVVNTEECFELGFKNLTNKDSHFREYARYFMDKTNEEVNDFLDQNGSVNNIFVKAFISKDFQLTEVITHLDINLQKYRSNVETQAFRFKNYNKFKDIMINEDLDEARVVNYETESEP